MDGPRFLIHYSVGMFSVKKSVRSTAHLFEFLIQLRIHRDHLCFLRLRDGVLDRYPFYSGIFKLVRAEFFVLIDLE